MPLMKPHISSSDLLKQIDTSSLISNTTQNQEFTKNVIVPSSRYGITVNDEQLYENVLENNIQSSSGDIRTMTIRNTVRNKIVQSKLYQRGNITVHKIEGNLCKIVVKAPTGNTHWGPPRETPIQSMQAALELELIADLIKTYPYSKDFKLLFEEIFKDSDYYDLHGVPSNFVNTKPPVTIPIATGSGEDTVITDITMESMLDIMREAMDYEYKR